MHLSLLKFNYKIRMLSRGVVFIILVLQIFLSLFDEFVKVYEIFSLNTLIALNGLALCSYIFLSKEKNFNLKVNKLKFTSLFLIGLIVVFYQPFIDLSLGFLDKNNSNLFIQPNNIIKTFLYSSIAVNSFLLGLTLFEAKPMIATKVVVNTRKHVNLKFLKLLNVFFFIIFLTQIDSSFLDATTYGTIESNYQIRNYAMLFFDTSFIALIIHVILNTGYRSNFYNYLKQYGLNIICFGFYLMLVLISGDRGPIIYLSLALLFGYIYLNEVKIKFIKILTFILFFSVLLGVVSTFRRTGFLTDITKDNFLESQYYPNSFSPLTKELAGSILTMSVATYNVPSSYPHFNGLFFIQNITLVIPGLNSFSNSQLGIKGIYFSSPVFLTYLSLGQDATWGVGSTAVADVYLDFGLLGIIVIFLLFGYLMKKLEVHVIGYRTKNFFAIVFYLLYFSFSIYIVRSNLLVPFTKFAYVVAFYYMVSKVKKIGVQSILKIKV